MRRAGIWLISDETYADLTFAGSHVTLLTPGGHVVAMSSFSRCCLFLDSHRVWLAHGRGRQISSPQFHPLFMPARGFTQSGCLAGLSVLDAYAVGVRS